jgi:hypothetical protein
MGILRSKLILPICASFGGFSRLIAARGSIAALTRTVSGETDQFLSEKRPALAIGSPAFY